MARIGISITKSVAFRNSTQEFTNVYFYQTNLAPLPDESQALAAIDDVVTREKTWHSSAVTFVRGRCWSQTGDKATSNMIAQKNLSGTGARATSGGMDKERAFLFRIRAGNDSRGNPVYLRKWIHACGQIYSGQSISAALNENSTGFTGPEITSLEAQVAAMKTLTINAIVWNLCAKGGRDFDSGANFKSHAFLEHHQLGDMWRAQ